MAGSDFWVSQRWFAGLTYSNVTFLAGVAALVRQQGTVCALKIKVHKPSFSSLSISNHSFYFFVFSGTKIIIMDCLLTLPLSYKKNLLRIKARLAK